MFQIKLNYRASSTMTKNKKVVQVEPFNINIKAIFGLTGSTVTLRKNRDHHRAVCPQGIDFSHSCISKCTRDLLKCSKLDFSTFSTTNNTVWYTMLAPTLYL